MSSPASHLFLSVPAIAKKKCVTAQHIPPSLHRQLYFTFCNLHLYNNYNNYTRQYFVCYSFIPSLPSSEFLHIAQTIQSLNIDPETCADTIPFGSFRGPSQSLILSSRDRDNTAQKQDLGTDSANKRRNRVDDKTCRLRTQLTWD